MSVRKPRQKWVLPDQVEPGIVACLSMLIPDSPAYRAAVNGALFGLTRWYNWADDPLHFAKDTADRMLDAYDSIVISPECPSPCPGAYAVPNDTNCPNEVAWRSVRMMSTGDTCDSHERVYFSRSIIDEFSGVARIGYSFFNFVTDDPCASAIIEIRAFQTGIGSPNWVLQWRDSANVDHEEDSSADDEFLFGAIPDAQFMCLSLNSNFCAVMTINGQAIPL